MVKRKSVRGLGNLVPMFREALRLREALREGGVRRREGVLRGVC